MHIKSSTLLALSETVKFYDPFKPKVKSYAFTNVVRNGRRKRTTVGVGGNRQRETLVIAQNPRTGVRDRTRQRRAAKLQQTPPSIFTGQMQSSIPQHHPHERFLILARTHFDLSSLLAPHFLVSSQREREEEGGAQIVNFTIILEREREGRRDIRTRSVSKIT